MIVKAGFGRAHGEDETKINLAQVPESGKIYSFNEGNYGSWAPHLQEYMNSLKDADKWGGKPYSAR